MNSDGYLEIILGCMYSGKSTKLVNIYKQCLFCNIKAIAINHVFDDRYDDQLLSTHDKIKIPCIKTEEIFTILDQLKEYDVILINEGQFFKDLYNCVVILLGLQKRIFICGLDGDFERNKFGQILDLIPLCDSVYKLTSLCGICKNGNKGIFSKRLTNEKMQTVVGSNNYIPVCRTCFEI